jgi:2-succinyl-5-enolpyruvyl-6-hydroxy-3-cyclohexene-1-carboxylate synthase
MAVALVDDGRFAVRVRLDERSAGYMALGIGLASGAPAIVLTTSGTAAAELHPAVVEADLARVPLIVCTADRPPELQKVGAPQTIEQRGLYGGSVRWSLEAGVPDENGRSMWRSLGSRVVAEAIAGPAGPGPVHVNLPFREPLLAPAGSPVYLPPGRSFGRPWHDVAPARRGATGRQLEELGALVGAGRPGVIVAGAGCGDPDAVLAAAAMLGWPLLADPRSGCRRVEAAGAVVVGAADALLRDEGFRTAHRPEVVLRLGEPWASKVLADWFADTSADGTVHVVTDPDWAWRDPGREAAIQLPCDPDELLAALLAGDAAQERSDAGVDADAGDVAAPPRPPARWAASWASAEEAAQQAMEAVIATGDELTEPFIARHISSCEAVGTVVVASSMPVRDLESFAKAVPRPPRVLSNRGANGIDGVASTTLGVAAAAAAAAALVGVAPAEASGARLGGGDEGRVTVGILGDLAFLHDLTAFVAPAGDGGGAPCVFVVVDNQGGGIFSFLPQAALLETERFEALFGTPQRPDVAAVARALGARVMESGTRSGFEEVFAQALESAHGPRAGDEPGPVVVVARTDRARNVEVHADLNAAVRAALASRDGD